MGIADLDGRWITATAKTLTVDGLNNCAAWIVPAGSISLAMYASVGKVGLLARNTATSQAFYNMIFDSDILRDFVYTRLVKADLFREWTPLISTGTQSNLNAKKVVNWTINIPTNDEQKQIGLLFNALDTLITLHQRESTK